MNTPSLDHKRWVEAQAAIELLFPSDPWEKGGPDATEAGDLIHLVREHARGEGFGWSFPNHQLGRTGTKWRLWGTEALLGRLRSSGLFDDFEAQGLIVSQPTTFVTAAHHEGVAFVRTRAGDNRLGGARQRRLQRRLESGQRRVTEEVHGPHRAPRLTPPSHLLLLIPSHRPSGLDGQPVRAAVAVQERPAQRRCSQWGGWVDAWGFSSDAHPMVVPNERHTAEFQWK